MIRLTLLVALLVFIAPTVAMAQTLAPSHSEIPTYQEIEVWLDPDERTLQATVRATVFGSGPIAVRLAPWLQLSALEVDGRPVANIERRPVLQVDLGGGDSHELLFTYSGSVPTAQSLKTEDASALPYIGPEGSYLPGGGWLPSLGSGHVTYRLAMTVPDRFRIIASGRLVSEHEEGGFYTAVVSNPHPAEEPSLFAGPYAIREHWHEGIRLRTYFHNELKEVAEDYLERSAAYLDRFSDAIGDYPFADFFVISSPLPVGLGFPNLTYVGRRVLRLPFMRGRSLAHEILHNWWGNGVYVDYPLGNWSEGLTTYMADYALAADSGVDAARDMRLQWLRDFAALPVERDFPVASFTAKTHDADQVIGYNKVAFIFHMLKREIGASAFTEGIRAFWKNHKFTVAGWPDLRRAFEAASGRDLAAFFDQWLDRAGAPTLHLAGAAVEPRPGDEQVVVSLAQDTPPYRLDVPLMVETANGQTSATARLDGVNATASIAVDSAPRAVSVDPGYELFRRLAPSEMPTIFRSVTLDPAAVAIIAAGDTDADAVARHLAIRLVGRHVPFASLDLPLDNKTPVLIIGTGSRVEAAITQVGGGTTPPILSGKGTARAWAGQRANGAAFAVVAADDREALAATLRALPHYGGASHLTFQGGKVIDSGVWPVTATPLRHTFNER